jgi:hypothetical protein
MEDLADWQRLMRWAVFAQAPLPLGRVANQQMIELVPPRVIVQQAIVPAAHLPVVGPVQLPVTGPMRAQAAPVKLRSSAR